MARLAQGRKQPGPKHRHADCPDAAEHDRGNRADKRRYPAGPAQELVEKLEALADDQRAKAAGIVEGIERDFRTEAAIAYEHAAELARNLLGVERSPE